MFNLVFLLAAAALVSYHSDFQASAFRTLTKTREVDNNLEPNVVPTPTRSRGWNFVRIRRPPPQMIKVAPGQRTVLECKVAGAPLAQVSWIKNGGEQILDFEEESNEIVSTDPEAFGVTIARVVIDNPVNGDVYTCLATTPTKQNTTSTTVFVEGESDPALLLENLLTPRKPVITYFLKSAFLEPGSNIVLPCRANGNAQVVWRDNYNNVIDANSRKQILPSGDLLISNLAWESDMGSYTCVAENESGEDAISTFVYPTGPSRGKSSS